MGYRKFGRLIFICTAGLWLSSNSASAFSRGEELLMRFTDALLYDAGQAADDSALTVFFEQTFGGQEGSASVGLERAQDLLGYLSFLESRVCFFQRNNELLVSFLRETSDENSDVRVSLERLLADEQQVMSGHDGAGAIRFQNLKTLEDYYSVLKRVEPLLLTRLKKLRIINDQMRSLKMDVLAQRRMKTADDRNRRYDERFEEMHRNMRRKDKTITEQSQEISHLKQKFSRVQLGLEVFRGRLQETDQRVTGLVNEIAARSMDLYSKEKEASGMSRQIDGLRSELNETRERLRLVQRIIAQKDEHIQSLEGEMSDLYAAVSQAPSHEKDVLALREEMNSLAVQLRSNIEESRVKIARLEDRFQDVVLANAQLRSELTKKGSVIALLKTQARQKNEMISDLEKGFHARSQKVMEMKDIVKIYKHKLKYYAGLLQQKELELQLYRERVSQDSIGNTGPHPDSGRINTDVASGQLPHGDDVYRFLWNEGDIRGRLENALRNIQY